MFWQSSKGCCEVAKQGESLWRIRDSLMDKAGFVEQFEIGVTRWLVPLFTRLVYLGL